MANIANAVAYSISNTVNNAAEIGKSIYTSKYINRFLANTYSDPLDYVVSYQDFFKDTLFESGLGMNNMVITMYADNDTIVNGGKVCNMKEIRGTEVYRYFQDNGLIRDYISSMMTAGHLRWSRRDGCFFSRSWTFMRK